MLAIVPPVKANPSPADAAGSTPGPPATDYCGGASCAREIGHAIAAVSGRWAIEVLEGIHFAGGACRFRDLQRRIGAISSKELSRQLGTLVANGVVDRLVVRPGHISYGLTTSGRALMQHMAALGAWAKGHGAPSLACGSRNGAASWLDPVRCGSRLPG